MDQEEPAPGDRALPSVGHEPALALAPRRDRHLRGHRDDRGDHQARL